MSFASLGRAGEARRVTRKPFSVRTRRVLALIGSAIRDTGSAYALCVLLPSDDPWASYARTIVEIASPRGTITVRAAQAGGVGTWPWLSNDAVHILTAWDPGEARPGISENRRRQASLEDEVRRLADAMWGAVGVDPENGYREEGIAVLGLSEADARTLGSAYRQDAVFQWTRDEWAIVACEGDRRVVFGWSAEHA